jgi:ATP/maltotriose-dependent transcriptional regulator MalT
MDDGDERTNSDLLAAGWSALAGGAWETAREAFMSALRLEESAEALEGLGWTASWLNDIPTTFAAREGAYRLYRDGANDVAAGRIAVFLAADAFLRRGEHAVANGWFQRAHHLLDSLAACPEQAMLGIWESYVTVVFHHDTGTARVLSAKARALANDLGLVDLEMLAQAALGFATVCEGDIAEGLRLLDEAATVAVAGEMTDPEAIVTTCCYLISACERIRDYDRAAQWCDRAIRLAERWSYRFMFAYCRAHYAGVLIWRGAWPEAETALAAATDELATISPAMAAEGIAQLAELRRRQGRPEEAETLLRQLDNLPLRAMGSKPALLGRCALALDRGDAATAVELAERFLRGIPGENRVERIDALELLARSRALRGEIAPALAAVAELKSTVIAVATPALRAKLALARGSIASASGDIDAARHHIEDAIDLFERAGAPYESACARLELAELLVRAERPGAAATEARAALAIAHQLGAVREIERASVLLSAAGAPTGHQHRTAGPRPLTSREVEVLRLVASGLSDREIGATLGLSEHTAHRHVANTMTKLNVPTRAAAVAQAARRNLL